MASGYGLTGGIFSFALLVSSHLNPPNRFRLSLTRSPLVDLVARRLTLLPFLAGISRLLHRQSK